MHLFSFKNNICISTLTLKHIKLKLNTTIMFVKQKEYLVKIILIKYVLYLPVHTAPRCCCSYQPADSVLPSVQSGGSAL